MHVTSCVFFPTFLKSFHAKIIIIFVTFFVLNKKMIMFDHAQNYHSAFLVFKKKYLYFSQKYFRAVNARFVFRYLRVRFICNIFPHYCYYYVSIRFPVYILTGKVPKVSIESNLCKHFLLPDSTV